MAESPQEEPSTLTLSQPVDSDGARQPVFNIPGVLHFLQHEWARFERERSNWEVERAELKAKIAFLQGERKGQENLKRDLLRRIKMLEYALKQERAKVHRLKNGVEENAAEPVKTKRPRDSVRDVSSAAQQASLRQGQHLLRQYLQEIGYADAVIGVRTNRLSTLLNLTGSDSTTGSVSASADSQVPMAAATAVPTSPRSFSDDVDSNPSSVTVETIQRPRPRPSLGEVENGKKVHTSSLKVTLKSRSLIEAENNTEALSSPVNSNPFELTSFSGAHRQGGLFEEEAVAASFDFLQGLADDDDKGSDEDEDDGTKRDDEVDNRQNENTFGNVDLLDPDQEAAIAEFEFLAHEAEDDDRREVSHRHAGSEEDYAQGMETKLLADSGPVTNSSLPPSSVDYSPVTPPRNAMQGNEWKVGIDPMQLSKLKDEYKQDRKNRAKASKRPTHSQLQQMMSSLNKGDEVTPPSSIPGTLPMPEASAVDEATIDGNELPGFAARMPGRKSKTSLLLPDSGVIVDSSGLGLGVLANLPEHIHNEADSQYDTSTNKVWGPRFSLRSHFDCVRSIAFHPTDQLLVTASEDCTLKLWNLQKPPQTKKSSIYDLEPLYTFRGHKGAVWCCCSSACGSYVFSGSSDTTICRWLLPSVSCDTYGSYGSCEELTDGFRQILKGHTDAVWDVRVLPGPDDILVSCAADSTCRLWRHDTEEPLLATVHVLAGQPSCVAPVPCDPGHFVVGTINGQGVLYDAETRQPIVAFNGLSDQIGLQRINRVATHPTLPVTVTAHEDRHLRFFDNRTGNRLHSMVAHLDGVTSLAVDPNGLFVASGSHDCSLRLWNFDTKTCVQEMTAHRKKYEESICDIAFHSVKPMIGSAGADAIAKVFM